MMKFKNIFGILAVSTLSLTAVSCSEDTMDRINQDNEHPAVNNVDAKFQLTDAIVSSVFSTNCGSLAWYVSIYTEQTFGTGKNQAKNAELRSVNEIAASSTFDNEWNSTYLNLNNIKQMIEKCAEGAKSSGQLDIKGMGQVLAAYNWSILTDMFGDIPCSESFNDTISAPKIDSQESIYKHCFELLDSAIVNFDAAIAGKMKNAGSQDVLFGSDCNQWRGLAHALKARLYLHTMGRAADRNSQLNTILAEANAALADGFNGALLDVFDGDANVNSWSAYWYSRQYIGSTTTVDNLMVLREDPREAYYNWDAQVWYRNPGVGPGIPGNESQAMMEKKLNFPMWLYANVAGIKQGSHLFSLSELYFILAEVKARLNQDAKEYFEKGVMEALQDVANSCGDNFTYEDMQTYLAGETAAKFAENPLNEILVQKYLSQVRDEQLETYNDMRRCKYVDGSYPVEMTNPENTSGSANRWPLRLPYGSGEVLSNPNVKAAFGSGNDAGMYIFTENVWWAGGSR